MKLLPFEYAARNLGRSPLRLVLSMGGGALVTLLVLASAAFVTGMQRSLNVSSAPNNVLLLGAGSEESIERSQIKPQAASVAGASLRGVRTRLGVPYVSPELHLALGVSTSESAKAENVVVRGVTHAAFLVHPQVRITDGRPPENGRDEVMVGGLVGSKVGAGALGVGDALWIDDRPWTISGVFEAPNTVMDAEVWMPLTDLQVVSQNDLLSCVVLTLDDAGPGAMSDVEAFAMTRLDLEISAMREDDYYASLSRFFAPIRAMVLVTAGLIAIGGVLGGLNTMYAAFAARVREVGTLQVLGYSRRAVLVSLVQESVLTAAAGSLVACALGMWVFDGVAVNFSMGAFGLIVDGPVVALALIAGLGLGVVGAIPPAVRCLRLPIPEALRA